MRVIGHLPDESGARTFGDFLYARGIDNQIEAERDGTWALWVNDEEQIETAKALLADFRTRPGDPRYREAESAAAEKRKRAAQENDAATKRYYDRSTLFPSPRAGLGILTALLIAASGFVGFLSNLGDDPQSVRTLFISERIYQGVFKSDRRPLPEVRRGEVWRLVTPIFLHFGVWHLAFNIMALLDFGTMVERGRGARTLAGLVLGISVPSNVAQYLFSGPAFGGMSGVVYGLIGYIWVRGRMDPASGLFLHQSTMTLAMIWFVLCLAGVIPNAANTVHAVGLGAGLAFGWVGGAAAGRGIRG
jgi:GlpG protein